MVKIKEDLYFNLNSVDLLEVFKGKTSNPVLDGREYYIKLKYFKGVENKSSQFNFEDEDKRDEVFDRVIDYHD